MTTPAPDSPPNNPYVGPRTFTSADRKRFFGRDSEATSLLARVVSERLLLFYAQSGAGKSSLINARLIPALREEEGFGVLPVGRVAGQLPTGVAAVDNIFLFNLMSSLDQGGDNPARLAHLGLVEFLEQMVTDDGLTWRYAPTGAEMVDTPSANDETGPPPRFALIIDQFEEIVTGHADRWRERADFFRQIDAALQANPNLWVVLSLREDYVASLDPYAPLTFNRLRARFYMERMGVAAALDAIRKPAESAGRPFAPGVAEKLVDDLRQVRVAGQEQTVAGQHVEPVQLQVVCFQMWAKLDEVRNRVSVRNSVSRDEITVDDLAEAGDVNQALTQFYEESLAAALADPTAASVSERQLRGWFDKELITEAGTRGLVRQGERETGSLPSGVVAALQKRFLVRGEARGGDTWIELVHDRFVEPIRQSNRAWSGHNLNPLSVDAQAWLETGKVESYLYGGSQLAAADAQMRANPAEFGEVERAFVEAGRQAESRWAARRQRAVAWGATALSLIFIALTVWALWSRGEAQDAQQVAEQARQDADAARAETERLTHSIRADQLTANGLKVVDENPPLALLLAAEGLRAQHDFTRTQPYTDTRIIYDFDQVAYVTTTAVITSAETVVGSAQTNMHELLGKVGGTPLPGHTDSVVAVAFSPDGRWLATASEDSSARLWDVSAADPTAAPIVLSGHADGVTAVAFSPDGRWLATGSRDSSTRLWDVSAADPAAAPIVLQGHADIVWAVAFSPDGHWLVTGSEDSSARLWDLSAADPAAAPIVLPGHAYSVSDVAFSPDGHWLATASDTARLWDVSAADPAATPIVLYGHAASIIAVAFSPDGHWLATGSVDNTARLWDVSAADPAATPIVLPGHASFVSAVAFSPDGQRLATGSNDNTARLWDVSAADPAAAPIVFQDHESPVRAVAFSPDGRWLVTGSDDRSARLWDVSAADPTAAPIVLPGHASFVRAVAFSPDGQRLATAGSNDNTARLWDVSAADPAAAPIVLQGHVGSVLAVAFSPDGHWLATVSGDLFGSSIDNTARLWDLSAADPTAAPIVLYGHAASVTAVAFSPDGQRLATASDDRSARLWDLSAAAPAQVPLVLTGHELGVSAVAFSPDGRWLATGSRDGSARLWDVSAADPAADPIVLQGHAYWVRAVAFSPDGHWLATGSGDSSIRLWDVSAADPAATPTVLQGHADSVRAVAFSPDGQRLATASDDNTARLWDLSAADPAQDPLVLTGHASSVTAVAFSPDGQRLATASDDRSARLWRWRVEDLIDLACRAAGRNLSVEEWQRYFADRPYRRTCERWPMHPSVTQPLRDEARSLAQQGDVEESIAKFEESLALDPSLPLEPEAEAKRIYAQALVEQGRSLAQQDDVAGAITKFEEALALDPSLPIEPEAEAKRIYAQALVEQGRSLAQHGDVAGAIARFEESLALDPSLPIEPEAEAKHIYAQVSPIAAGETVTGTVTSGVIELWSFDAAAAITVTIDLMADNSTLYPYLYLYAPDGSTVVEYDYLPSSTSHIEATLSQAGRYLIGVAGYFSFSNGAYRLSLSVAGTKP